MGDFKAIGKAFIDFYYSKFDTGPREGVAALYVKSSREREIVFPHMEFVFLLSRNLPMV